MSLGALILIRRMMLLMWSKPRGRPWLRKSPVQGNSTTHRPASSGPVYQDRSGPSSLRPYDHGRSSSDPTSACYGPKAGDTSGRVILPCRKYPRPEIDPTAQAGPPVTIRIPDRTPRRLRPPERGRGVGCARFADPTLSAHRRPGPVQGLDRSWPSDRSQ